MDTSICTYKEVVYEAHQTLHMYNIEKLMKKKKTQISASFTSDHDPNRQKFYLKLQFGVKLSDWLHVIVYSETKNLIKINGGSFMLLNHSGIVKENKFLITEISVHGAGGNFYHFVNYDENEEFRLKCKIKYYGSKIEDENNNNNQYSLMKDLSQLLMCQDDTDVSFKFKDGQSFGAHKIILKARSIYFKRLFESGMVEAQTNEINVEDHDLEAFKEMLRFLYTDNPPANLKDISLNLLPIADQYLLPRLKSLCADSLKENIKNEDLKETLLLSHKFDLYLVKRVCFKRLENLRKESKDLWKEIKDDVQFTDLVLDFIDFLSESRCFVD